MANLAAPAQRATAPPRAAKTRKEADRPIQKKLAVGPSHDRFEAEADRVAESVTSRAGPANPPAISPLAASPSASRKAIQREEKRSIETREKKPDEGANALGDLLQRKTESAKPKLEDDTKAAPKRAQAKPKAAPTKKPDEKVQAKPKIEPVPIEQPDKRAQAKRLPGPSANVEKAKDEKQAQAKPASSRLQRDSVDDDTVLETSILSEGVAQTKRIATAQRETVAADTAVEQEEQPQTTAAPVQREATSADGFTAPSHVESGIAAMRGSGAPLSGEVRDLLEPRFGRDLSNVRVHDGARAADLSNAVNARAFTVGQDIFFGAGQYQPATSGGSALLAHEVTHTIQQGGGSSRAQPARIQRNGKKKAAASTTGTPATPVAGSAAAPATADTTRYEVKNLGEFVIDGGRRVLRMKALPVPKVGGVTKGMGDKATPGPEGEALGVITSRPWSYRGKSKRGSTTARRQWLDHVGNALTGAVQKKADKAPKTVQRGGQTIVYLRSSAKRGDGRNFLIFGTVAELAVTDELRLPIWNKKGEGTLFDVDHIHELQLGGLDGFPNFWLLQQGANRSSGSNIAGEMNRDFTAMVEGATTAKYFDTNALAPPTWDGVRQGNDKVWEVEYVGTREIKISGTQDTWTEAEVMAGTHLDELNVLTEAEIKKRGLVYSANPDVVNASIYALATARGGFYRTINYSNPDRVTTTDKMPGGAAGSKGANSSNQFYRGLSVAGGGITMARAEPPPGSKGKGQVLLGSTETLAPDTKIANIHGQPFPSSGKITSPAIDIPILWREEFGFGGYASKSWINELMGRLSIEGMSPIKIHEAGLSADGEMFASGEIEATKQLFPDLKVPLILRGNDIFISFPIPTDRLSFGPVRVTEAAIDVGFGDNGIFLGGHADVKIDHVGSGKITARHDARDTILEGKFVFDLDFLDPAEANIRYSFGEDKLTLGLKAGVKEGTLPGVAGGQVSAAFSRDAIDITGTLNLAAPLTGSTITVGYTKETGLTIAADNIPLPINNIPGITDATLSASANMNPEDGSWKLSGVGTAKFAIPPVTGQLTIAMQGPVITITGTAAFKAGLAEGSLSVTATNAQLDEAGQPVPDQVAKTFSITGKGSASLKFGILTGTAAIEITPDQRVVVVGTIALPPSHELFDKRKTEKELLHVEPPEFPIWGFSVAGIGIGVFAFVDAKLTFDAFVGPGTLQNTQVSVTFDIEKPEEAVVDGTAAFVVPAGAGLTLDIGGGLRARAAVAFVEGRVGLDARLGLAAEARADVALHWSQIEGLSLNASAHAEAHPQFDIGANASITAGVDLGLFEVDKTFGPWRQSLGSFGPDIALGVTVPIAWSEKAGLDFDVDKIDITKPDIDFGELMTDGFMQLI